MFAEICSSVFREISLFVLGEIGSFVRVEIQMFVEKIGSTTNKKNRAKVVVPKYVIRPHLSEYLLCSLLRYKRHL